MTQAFLCKERIHFKSWSSEVKEVQYHCSEEWERRVTKGEARVAGKDQVGENFVKSI